VRDGGTGVRQQQIVEAARAILEAYGQDGLTMRRLAEALRPSVLEVVPGRTLRWLGHLLLPGVFDGEHHFEIEPLGGNRCTLVQQERFSGLLVPLLAKSLDEHSVAGIRAMNVALKERAEAPVVAPAEHLLAYLL
jgi:hypothetical protein